MANILSKINSFFSKKTIEKEIVNKEETKGLEIIEALEEVIVKYNGKILIHHNSSMPFVSVLRGEVESDIKIKTKIRKIVPLFAFSIENKTKTQCTINFKDRGYNVIIDLKLVDEVIEIAFSGKENYDLVELNFEKGKDEFFVGGGDESRSELVAHSNKLSLKEKNIIQKFTKKEEETLEKDFYSNVLVSNYGYVVITDSKNYVAHFFDNCWKVRYDKNPTSMKIYFGNNISETYKKINKTYKNNQKLLVKYTKGIIITLEAKDFIKKAEKLLKTQISINSVIIKDNMPDYKIIKPIYEYLEEKKISIIVNVNINVSRGTAEEISDINKYIDSVRQYINGVIINNQPDSEYVENWRIIEKGVEESVEKLSNSIYLIKGGVNSFNNSAIKIIDVDKEKKTAQKMLNSSMALIGTFAVTATCKEFLSEIELLSNLPLLILEDNNYKKLIENEEVIVKYQERKESIRGNIITAIEKAKEGQPIIKSSGFFKIEEADANIIFIGENIIYNPTTKKAKQKKDNIWQEMT